MKITRILAALCFALLFVTQAQAADTCNIREYNRLASIHDISAQIAQEPGIADQVTGDFTSVAVQSSLFQPGTNYVCMQCNVNASYLVGTNPTAANTNFYYSTGAPYCFGVPIGGANKLSVHTYP